MSQMVNQFSMIPTCDVPRNVFQRNHTWKGTIDSGYLYPVFFDEALPGDTKKLNTTFFGRLSTPFVPFFDNVYLNYQLYGVPIRLLWEHWPQFMGERKNPNDSIDYVVPTLKAGETGFKRGGFFDYLSLPPGVKNSDVTSAVFYARAYNLIWNEWYRDENLQDSIEIPLGDGPDNESMYPLLKRGKRGDYFTTCLPSPQKGPGVEIPIVGSAPVVFGEYTNTGQASILANKYPVVDNINAGGAPDICRLFYSQDLFKSGENVPSYSIGSQLPYTNLYADLSQALSPTINSLRQAVALQQFLEKDARGGTRYIELILSHFGVKCPDYRLQRPEYLGGSTSRIVVNPIAQTSSSDNVTPQGNLAAIGTVESTGSGFTHSFTEHCVILGLVCIYCDLNYQQGIDRHFLRKTRYDYFFPTLAHLGEQGVYNKEIYAQGNDVKDSANNIIDDNIFGYQERFAEYRYKNSYITGKFRSSDPQSLDIWHLAQNFESLPTLSASFIEENPPLERVLAVQDEPQILLDCFHDFQDIRPIPVYGTPGLRRL